MSKWKVVVLVVVGLLVGLVLAGYFILPVKLKPLLEDKISKALSANIESLYTVEVSDLALTGFWSELQLNGVSIFPDTTRLNQLDSAQVPAMIFHMELAYFSISTGGLISVAREKKDIKFSDCIVDSLDLQLWSNPHAKKKEDKKSKEQNIRFDDIQLSNLNADYREWPATDSTIGSIKSAYFNGGLQLKQMADSMVIKVDNQQVEMGVDQLALFVPGDLYRIETDSLRIDNDSSRFAAHGFRLIPLYDKQEFQKHLTEQSDRIDCEVKLVQIDAVDWNAVINGGNFLARSALIEEVRLEAYRDRAVPFNEARRPKLPIRLLRELPVDLELSSVELRNFFITYKELPEDETEAAVISFDGLNAMVTNITNRPESMRRDSTLIVEANSNLFEGPKLAATFTYNLMDINGGYTVSGNLESFRFPILNGAIGPLTGMHINKGLHKSTVINLTGNDFNTTGEILMLYEDLEVDTYPNRSKLRKTITRWTTKSLLYYTDNPKSGDQRNGEVQMERDPARFIFNYWWNSYLSGVKSSVLRTS